MPDEAAIVAALLARCEALSVGSPALPKAMPDIAFDPAAEAPDGRYLEIKPFLNRPAWEGLDSGRIDQGLLQIDVVWPRNGGLIKPLAAARAVREHFAKGTVMGGVVRVSREPWSASPLYPDNETRIPVTIPWVT